MVGDTKVGIQAQHSLPLPINVVCLERKYDSLASTLDEEGRPKTVNWEAISPAGTPEAFVLR